MYEADSLENDFLKVRISTRAKGVSIVSIYNKKSRKEWIYSRKDKITSRIGNDTYDNQYFGGCEFLFPNDLPVNTGGLKYQDHGFLWTTEYTGHGVVETDDGYSINYTGLIEELTIRTSIRAFLQKKKPGLELSITLKNTSDKTYPYLLRLHPSFLIGEDSRLFLNGERILFEENETASYCSFRAEGHVQEYPRINTDMGCFSVEELPKTKISELFCHILQKKGSFEVKDGEDHIRVSYRQEDFPCLTVYYINKDQRIAVIEPDTGSAAGLDTAMEAGTARKLYPLKEEQYTVRIETHE